ncbi:tRNA (adenosine(37)-N6)-dimethylallyltransferase MiaA [Gorillibacterium massiliense]|uniref:tRNA (adenosine(37)-N6)-dimethylallyltransferase MiaA n=1 Tax=Gorillibacterium massiliense TaxID=1280390 RepID=UPI0004BBA4F0|nr:tRNA (adenosine(37)-N6)-dimethylallyltransferase MiaA [Gorillibacterium massiliense]
MTNRKPPLLILLGPTASGKTKLSVEIAKANRCEIISGDSMQVYRGMDVGTAKIKPEEMEGVPHHLLDIVDPDTPFSAADFQTIGKRLIDEIAARGKLPFIVGGTGLYIEALIYGYEFSEGGADPEFRKEQEAYFLEFGEQALHDRLREIDPASAERLHPRDSRRIIRALEVAHLTGVPLSEQLAKQTKESPYEVILIGLTLERNLLYKRIEERIDTMLANGLVEEVQILLDRGYSPSLVSMQGLGYKEIVPYLQGYSSYDEAVYLLKRNTRRFAKRQLSWFRHMKEIQWVDVTDSSNFSAHLSAINAIIAGKFA